VKTIILHAIFREYLIQKKLYLDTNAMIQVEIDGRNIQIPLAKMKKILFIYNALEGGWSVKKSGDSYVFSKKHENRREIFQENYLERFIQTHFEMTD
jgi:hypothetical protein